MAGTEGKLKALQAADAARRLSKEHLLTPKIVRQEVSIDSLGGTVVLESLSYAKRSELKKKAGYGTPEFDAEKMELLSIVFSLIEPELTFEDLEELKKQGTQVIDELSTQISFLNTIGEAVDLKKGLAQTMNFDSPLSSPSA